MKRVMLLALLVAASAAHAATPARRAVYASRFGTSFNQIGASEATTAAIRGAFTLRGGRVVPDLVAAARADARGVTYTIRRDAFWYWGGRKVPVTYRDFVYTLQEVDSPNAADPAGPGMGNLDPSHYSHRGLRQVTFDWRRSSCSDDFPCGPYANWQSLFPAVYPGFALAGVDFSTLWTSCICGSDGKPVASGPFYLASYAPDRGVAVLKRNPFWGGPKPALAEIDLRDTEDGLEALRLGSVDATRAGPLAPELATFRAVPGVVVQAHPAPVQELLFFRVAKGVSNELLRAPWMRKAIALGIDRRAIVAQAYGELAGVVPTADSFVFYPGTAGYAPNVARWNHDPRKALAILKAHCSPGTGPPEPDPSTTKVWQCDGLPAVFRWTWRADAPVRTQTEQLAKAELRAIGISIVDRPLPATTLFAPSGLPSGDFDIADLAIATSYDPGDLAEFYRCGGAGNYTGFCSKKVDDLLSAGNGALDPAKRRADFAAADRLLSTTLPSFPLFVAPNVLVRNSALLGIDPNSPLGSAEYWHWKR